MSKKIEKNFYNPDASTDEKKEVRISIGATLLEEGYSKESIESFLTTAVGPILGKTNLQSDADVEKFNADLKRIISNFEIEQGNLNKKKDSARVMSDEESLETSVDIEELLTFAQEITKKVDSYRNQLGYEKDIVHTSPRQKALNSVFQMKMKAGKLAKMLEKIKVNGESVEDNQVFIDAAVKYISTQEDLVKKTLMMSEEDIDMPEPTVEFHLEGRKKELETFEKKLEAFLTEYPAATDESSMAVLQNSFKKTVELADSSDDLSRSSVLWELASQLDSLNTQLDFLEEVYSAPDKMLTARQNLQERMQESFAEENQKLLLLSGELFDLLGENETNLEEFGFHSPQVKQTNDTYAEVLRQFDKEYQVLQHAFERSQVQAIIDGDTEMVESSFAELQHTIVSEEKLNADQKALLSNQLISARALYITQTGGYSHEPTETDVHNAVQQWQSSADAISQYLSSENNQDQKQTSIDTLAEEGDSPTISAIEAGFLQTGSEQGAGQILAEQLPALDTKRRGWKGKLKGLGSEVLNRLAVMGVVAGVLYNATAEDAPETKMGIQNSPAVASVSKESVPDVQDNLELGSLVMPIESGQSPFVSVSTDVSPSVGNIFASNDLEAPAEVAPLEAIPAVDDVLNSNSLVVPNVLEQAPAVSTTIDSIPVSEAPQMQHRSDQMPDAALEQQPIEYTFQKGNKINTVSEAALDVWRRNPDVLNTHISLNTFKAAMWSVLAGLEKNSSQETELTKAMSMSSTDIDHVHINEKIDLRAFYDLINQRL